MKKATVIIATLAAIALLGAVPVFPGTIPSSIVPETAKWVVHLDMEKFVATGLYGYLEKDGKFEIKSRDLDRWFKMDVPKDIKGVTVFGLGPGDEADRLRRRRQVRQGRASSPWSRPKRTTRRPPYGAYTLYSSGERRIRRLHQRQPLVFSEGRAAIEKVLDTAGGKAKNFAGTPLSASLKEVPAGAFLSGVLPDLSGLGKEFGQSKVLDKASGLFFLAQEKKDTLLVRLQVTAESPESAKNMADVVQGLIAMGRLGGNEGDMAKIASLLDGLQVKLDGKVLRLDFERPSKEIADLLSKGKGFEID